jgi:type I restriction enzyme S subunit
LLIILSTGLEGSVCSGISNYFKKESFIKQLSSTVIGIRDGKQISYDAFGWLKLRFPSSIKEQQQIAVFLEQIEKKIGVVDKQLDHLKIYKKGLLQQMFV